MKYTFGLFPLQQYLIDIDNGRIQSLTIAWDSRSKADGGQRWFSLYPGEKILPGESIHWTGRDQNWNFMCSECHSTNVKKNYDPAQPRYTTSWTDISVNCEACHGAGSAHVEWAGKQQAGGKRQAGRMGLVVEFDERQGVTWPIDPATGIGVRSSPRRSDKEVETCGLCHARRAQLKDGYVPGHSLGTTDQVALLEPGLFWSDGQMRDEIYNYAPFLPEQDVPQGRHLQRLPRSAHAAVAGTRGAGLPDMPCKGKIRGAGARSSPRGDEAGGLRELSHAISHVHGDRRAA